MPLNIPKPPPEPVKDETPKDVLASSKKKKPERRSVLKQVLFGPDQKERRYGILRRRGDKKKYPKRSVLEQVLFGPRSREKKDGKKDRTAPKKVGLPKIFKRSHYREWLRRSGRVSGIFHHRLPRHKIVERGTGLLPPRTGTGYVKSWQMKEKEKELRKQHYQARTQKEKAEIKKDIKLLQEYKKELETSQGN